MARIEHRRVLLRLYEDVPRHQEILRWLDGHSGRGLQEILRDALLIGLPRLLGESPQERSLPLPKPEPPVRESVPERVLEPAPVPERLPEPKRTVPEQGYTPAGVSTLQGVSTPAGGAMPDFVPSQQSGSTNENQVVARQALTRLFETEDKS
ncbi:hypothetical protein [Acidithiobacillus ferriphilus]|uniref:hypothetical protein n=1 Tax=Acidithiobacillus ferriphilus TaxID=1689834 RepID=UPI001C065E41|nr:hypothetical protein [Acidithiobacillus ferriphilus]MBU2853335.1 hypothetical protein [Acidithiobacillus ferriphilus]